MTKRSTEVGYENPHGLVVIRRTNQPGNHYNQILHVLHCKACGHELGSNGCDNHLRRCPKCMHGAPGLPIPPVEAA